MAIGLAILPSSSLPLHHSARLESVCNRTVTTVLTQSQTYPVTVDGYARTLYNQVVIYRILETDCDIYYKGRVQEFLSPATKVVPYLYTEAVFNGDNPYVADAHALGTTLQLDDPSLGGDCTVGYTTLYGYSYEADAKGSSIISSAVSKSTSHIFPDLYVQYYVPPGHSNGVGAC